MDAVRRRAVAARGFAGEDRVVACGPHAGRDAMRERGAAADDTWVGPASGVAVLQGAEGNAGGEVVDGCGVAAANEAQFGVPETGVCATARVGVDYW